LPRDDVIPSHLRGFILIKRLLRVFVCAAGATMVAAPVAAATLRVCASGCDYSNLQAAVDAAAPGDTILLRAGETFSGHVLLPAKPASSQWITIRSDAADSLLPSPGVRLVPAGKEGANTSLALLPRLVGLGGTLKATPVVRTAPGAHHYRLQFLDIDGTANIGYETLVAVGEDSGTQTATDIVFDRVYIHGHPYRGQKRGIALNGVRVDVLDSYISDIKAVNADSQAIAGYNGAGPFRIINNHLEGAGENIMFGGADPSIANLVPSNIEVRRNLITKPLAWRDPIVAAPQGVHVAAGGGGALPAGTHYFRIVALMETGPRTAHSVPSLERAVAVGAGGAAAVSWSPVPGADRYRVYRGTSSGASSHYVETTATSLTYAGAGESSGAPAAQATYWVVKNLIELKNARHVVFDGNVIENIWASGQFGYAIVLTPRNQMGTAPWTVVSDVTFTNNIIRHAAGVIQIVGYDSNATSQQTQRIALRNNLMYDINPAVWGDYTKAILIGEGPSGVVIDHNTIIHANSSLVYAHGTRPIPGFVFTNNVAPHGDYGIMADGGQPGNFSIGLFFPSGVVQYNVIEGGNPASYPLTNTWPNRDAWLASFTDPLGNDFRLLPSSPFYAAGSGGNVPGADFGQLVAALTGGTPPPAEGPEAPPPPPPPASNTPPVARPGGPYVAAIGAPFVADGSASSDAEGPIAAFTWRWHDDIVIHASAVPAADIVGSAWQRVQMGDAAGGTALLNPDRGAGKISTAQAAPGSYVDVRFHAAAGVPYRLWIRARAERDAWTNDSMFLQFSGRVDAQGRAIDRIGTTAAASYVLEEGSGAGVSGWGWNDDTYGATAAPIYFAASGPQTLRIQQREDGILWDQIVISAAAYGAKAPGATRSDGTIVPLTLGTSSAVVPSKTYAAAGVYPVLLTVQDAAGLTASAMTSATVSAGGAPGLTASAGGPYSGGAGQALTFDGTRSQATSAAQYYWRFGDEIVLRASDFAVAGGRWVREPDASAAGGSALVNANLQQPKITTPAAAPASYVEASFTAAAGVPYRFWIRMRADGDAWTNDSIFVQFSGSVTAAGAAIHRIGTTGAMGVVLEEGNGAGVQGWGWADGGYGSVDGPIYFTADGEQRIRIQQREDGLRIDQIVISAGAFATAAPGALKQDATIVPVFAADARGAVPQHVYRAPGLFPVQLLVIDGAATATAATTATIR
jgi:hypothetical protein